LSISKDILSWERAWAIRLQDGSGALREDKLDPIQVVRSDAPAALLHSDLTSWAA